jgi:hypothetical protein
MPKLSPDFVAKAKAKPGGDRTTYWDAKLTGLGLMVTASGHKSFVFTYRANGVQRRMKLDGDWLRHEAGRGKNADRIEPPRAGEMMFAIARREAEAVRGAVAQGRDPLAELRAVRNTDKNSLRAIAEDYLTREGKNLRSTDERKGVLRRYVYPRFGGRPIDSIRRTEIVRMLDKVEDENGPVAAEHALAIIRRIMNWHATRDDDFLSPIVRGMSRISPKDRARTRILEDDELRLI